MFTNLQNETIINRDGDLSGQPIAIENCHNSLILVLDNLASVTIDDCKNCIFILGPIQGSIFIRDCADCILFTACQQFRSRDCVMKVGLFCSTAPIIEEVKAQICPLFLDYPGFEDQMQRVGLNSKPNLFSDVQDFTPDISELQVHNEPINWDFKEILPNIDALEVFEKEQVKFDKKIG